uniref:Bystin n=1 Tax=Calcidiscus leptoporus TaxID=127549 RepID=A0A7S0NVA8_9EUKA
MGGSTRAKSPARARGKSPARRRPDAQPQRATAKRKKGDTHDDDGDDDDSVMPVAMTRKIIASARAQQEEVDAEMQADPFDGAGSSMLGLSMRDDDDDDGSTAGGFDDDGAEDDQEAAEYAYDEAVEELELSEQDQRALELFMGGGAPRTLQDIIMQKIAEHTEGGGEHTRTGEDMPMPALPPKVIEVYKGVGKLLKTYKSGKLPKAFKIVPRLSNWEEVLYVTEPELWSPAATREATKLFASNMNAKMAQRFFNLVLLPNVQYDIRSNGKLNFHLYHAVKKSIFKPAAFFKGVLLPLGEGSATLKEALIMCSVLAKVSVPMLHSAVAILKLSEMRFSGANALFLRTLLLKKYALPYRVVDQLVEYFVSFKEAENTPTLLWQQCLLAFAQHYKTEVSAEQKNALKALLRSQPHPKITPEIRRELFSSRNRGDPYIPQLAGEEDGELSMHTDGDGGL